MKEEKEEEVMQTRPTSLKDWSYCEMYFHPQWLAKQADRNSSQNTDSKQAETQMKRLMKGEVESMMKTLVKFQRLMTKLLV